MSRILVIEDNKRWQAQIVELLEEVNLSAVCTSTFDEALEALHQYPIDLAIVDINLTDVPGNRDGEKLVSYLDDIPYIIISGTIPVHETIATRRAFAFFSKQEFEKNIDEFLQTVNAVIRLSNSRPLGRLQDHTDSPPIA